MKYIIRNISIDNYECEFDMYCDESIANALRRIMMMNLETIAPSDIIINKNTTCQTDEYIAHRIGLIPFIQNNKDKDLSVSLSVKGKTATTEDLIGNVNCPKKVEIMNLIENQELDLTIVFRKGSGEEHSRFCSVAGVGFEKTEKCIHFVFESINFVNPIKHLENALNLLEKKIIENFENIENNYETLVKK